MSPLHTESTPTGDPANDLLQASDLLWSQLQRTQKTGGSLQFTIEARELTSEYTHRPSHDSETRRVVVEADDPSEAINRYVVDRKAQLVSFMRPGRSQESIATVKQEDSVFLVRVYAA